MHISQQFYTFPPHCNCLLSIFILCGIIDRICLCVCFGELRQNVEAETRDEEIEYPEFAL